MKDPAGQKYEAPIFSDGEDIRGKVFINLLKGKNVEHMGVRVECVGVHEYLPDSDRNATFLQLWKDLEPPGALTDNMAYDFCFTKCEKPHESYNGKLARVRYYVNVVINRQFNKLAKEHEFVVYNR